MRLLLAIFGWIAASASKFNDRIPPPQKTEQWKVWELALDGPSEGNPFAEVSFAGTFVHADQLPHQKITAQGSWSAVYRLRGIPSEVLASTSRHLALQHRQYQ